MTNRHTTHRYTIAGSLVVVFASLIVWLTIEPARGDVPPGAPPDIVKNVDLDAPEPPVTKNMIDAQNPYLGWELEMVSQYPESYGGLVFDNATTIQVLEAKVDPAFEALALRGPTPTADAFPVQRPTTTRITKVAVPFVTLMSARDELANELQDLTSVGINGVGLRVAENKVVVLGTDEDTAMSRLANSTASKDELLIFEKSEISTTSATRYVDSPPWNGGDRIWGGFQPGGVSCTTGFGTHAGTYSTRQISTAGHCGTDAWFNSPFYPGGNLVGSTDQIMVGYFGMDAQTIPTSSSCIVWKGASTDPSNVARWLMTGWFDLPSGPVYLEGSWDLEQSGNLYDSNMDVLVYDDHSHTLYTVTHAFKVTAPNLGGDSGGAIVQDSGYGPLATGTIISQNGPTGTVGQYFSAYLYTFALQLNKTTNASYCNNA